MEWHENYSPQQHAQALDRLSAEISKACAFCGMPIPDAEIKETDRARAAVGVHSQQPPGYYCKACMEVIHNASTEDGYSDLQPADTGTDTPPMCVVTMRCLCACRWGQQCAGHPRLVKNQRQKEKERARILAGTATESLYRQHQRWAESRGLAVDN